jgi:hypothetical protein
MLLLLPCFLFALALQAQDNNFRPAYIITMKQDTIYGEIDLRTNRINAQRCTFRATGSDEIREFKPFDILGYRFIKEGKFYVSKEIVVRQGQRAPVFLEYLLEGMRSLYYYETQKSVPVYFVQKDNQLVKVDAPSMEDRKAGYITRQDKARYMARLRAVYDAPQVESEIANSTYTRSSMIKIARDYHYATCTTGEDCIEFGTSERGKAPLLWTFTPYAGVIQNFIPHRSGKYNPDLSYIVGITVSVTNPRMSKVISFTADLSISQYAGYAITPTSTAGNHRFISHKLGARFTLPNKGRVRPFGGLGVDLSAITGHDHTVFGGSLLHCGYYLDAGLNFQLSKQRKNMIMLRGRYNALYKGGYTGGVSNRAFDGTVGVTF